MSPLSGCLYPKPLVPLTKSIAWGRHYESIAIEKYTFHMKALGKNVVVNKVALSYTQRKDGLVHPQMGLSRIRLTNFRMAYLRSSVSTQNKKRHQKKLALTYIFIANWKTTKLDSKIHMHTSIKSNCRSMLQVTCVNGATSVFIPAKAYLSSASSLKKWQKDAILLLQSFFDDFMLPEIVLVKYKPSYCL